SLLLERAAADAETDGYAAIEGYPRKRDKREEFDYYGPVRIFENAGFVNISEKYDVAIMRREF
ncbi:MAG: hypothetical protein LBS62_13180, partial [Clostridiales bacterium]|nr:hypothetical protein [Clostridiales bacterium]